MLNSRKIAIIGGGPGGLMLARLLQMQNMTVTIFEADVNADARRQGGSLDLHSDSGLLAVDEAGLMEAFDLMARYDDQADALYDYRGKLHHSIAFSDAGRPEIDRAQLRDLLLGSLLPGTVLWDRQIVEIVPHPNWGHEVVGQDWTEGPYDLVVGADGAWSRVRKILTGAVPRATGLIYYEWEIVDIDHKHPELARLLPKGKIAAVADDRGFVAQRSSGGRVKVFLMLRDDDGAIAAQGRDIRLPVSEVLKLMTGWSENMTAFARAASADAVMRPLMVLPSRLSWPPRKGVTLLGDAAHVMAPLGGEGVNMALEDARQLAHALLKDTNWDAAIKSYEAEMFARVGEIAERSNNAAATWPRQTVEMIQQLEQEAAAPQSTATSFMTPAALIYDVLGPKTAAPELQRSLGAAFQFDVVGENGGNWIVDFRADSAGVRLADGERGKCTITMQSVDFVDMVEGRLSPRVGFMTNKLKVAGDMMLAARFSEVLKS